MRQAHPVGSEWWRAESLAAGDVAPRAAGAAAAEATESPVPYWALMGFTVILLLAPQRLVPALEPYRVGLITAGIAMISHRFDRLRRGQPVVHPTRGLWIAGLRL